MDKKKEIEARKEKEKLCRDITKEFKDSCIGILKKGSPNDLEGLQREQNDIVEQLKNQIDNLMVSILFIYLCYLFATTYLNFSLLPNTLNFYDMNNLKHSS